MSGHGTFTVAELSQAIAAAVARAFPQPVWVRGEIRDLSRAPSGHVYFNLVDHADDPVANAPVLPVTLFESDRRVVNRIMKGAGAGRMTDGVEVRIRGTVGHYAARGTVQLRMTGIDPEFTLGRLVAERDRVLRLLAAEGLVGRNRDLAFPLVPLRVGLVTSVGSAAHADFLHELGSSGFAFEVLLADARVQGVGAESSIVDALEAVCARGAEVAAIVRGGGSRLDLATFDREQVARAVASSPVPVVTGIGHEIDETATDRVAAAAYKTPTACAGALVAAVARFVERLDRDAGRLALITRAAAVLVARRLDDGAARLERAAAVMLRRRQVEVETRAARTARSGAVGLRAAGHVLAAAGRRVVVAADRRVVAHELVLQSRRRRLAGMSGALSASDRRVDVLQARVEALDPLRALARGWSITRDPSGRVVRSVGAVAPGDRLTTTLRDGTVTSIAESTLPAGHSGATIGPRIEGGEETP